MKSKKSHPNPMADAIGQALDADKKRAKQKYDGVVGTLPDWVPDPLQEEFKATRDYLLDYFSDDPASPHTKVKKLMAARKKESFPTSLSKESPPIRFPFTPYIPPEVKRDLDALIYIQQIVLLEKNKGISSYLGESGNKVYRGIVTKDRQKEIAKRSRLGALQELIIEIVRKEPDLTAAEVLAVLKTHAGGPVIEYVDEDDRDEKEHTIAWHDPSPSSTSTPKSASITGIKNRVTRARKFISSH